MHQRQVTVSSRQQEDKTESGMVSVIGLDSKVVQELCDKAAEFRLQDPDYQIPVRWSSLYVGTIY